MGKKYKVGYTQGTFDLFHIGHLTLLLNAKELCDFLIVGINSDNLVKEYKHHFPIISQQERKQIVESIKVVDQCVIVETLDKVSILKKFHFDVVFIGDDWKNTERYKKAEEQFSRLGNIKIEYLPYTKGISTTDIKTKILKMQNNY